MLEALKYWSGTFEIDGQTFNDIERAKTLFKSSNEETRILLHSKQNKRVPERLQSEKQQYKITVKEYMTRKASPSFDFMAKWNNDNPMPLRTMVGTIEKETRGMVYMNLHGQAESVVKCMRCGRTLTNEVSKMYGIGPECITKVPFIMNLDMNDVEGIKKKLADVKWSGWIIKSAIIEEETI